MGLLEGLLGKIDLKEIESQALAAKQVQDLILKELRLQTAHMEANLDEMKTLNSRIKLLAQLIADNNGSRKGGGP